MTGSAVDHGDGNAERGTVRGLVVAKAPVPGLVKTRLGADVGHEAAARLAAAALLDTLDLFEQLFPDGARHLSMAGDLAEAADGAELTSRLAGWQVHEQRGDDLGERLAHAHADVAASGPGGVVQVGMDTPHIGRDLLVEVVAGVADGVAVLGPADDGGWWVLGLADPVLARCLVGVPMSTESTGEATAAALREVGLQVLRAPSLRDVDTVADAELVAGAAPDTRFARRWREEVAPTLGLGRD